MAAFAREKLEVGAQLLEIYTGYIYRGSGLLRGGSLTAGDSARM
jgi:dihydroorotate dehydrogenase